MGVPSNAEMTCSTCQRRFRVHESKTLPFCSERCQLIDLGRWLNEEIGVPHEGDPGESDVEQRQEPHQTSNPYNAADD
ncbi:MAG: DNA gyrase inhibitor YacG [Planctomycetota bacterium]